MLPPVRLFVPRLRNAALAFLILFRCPDSVGASFIAFPAQSDRLRVSFLRIWESLFRALLFLPKTAFFRSCRVPLIN